MIACQSLIGQILSPPLFLLTKKMIVNIGLEIAALCVSTIALLLIAFYFPKALTSKPVSKFNQHDHLIFQLIFTAIIIQILVIANACINIIGFFSFNTRFSYGVTWREDWMMSPFIVVACCGL
jgi:hypothetical protein